MKWIWCSLGTCIALVYVLWGHSETVYAAGADVLFPQDKYSVSEADEFTVTVVIRADERIGYYDVRIQYDAERLAYLAGAEGVSDGVITLQGTGWGTEVTYQLTFAARSGGSAGLCVKDAHVFAEQDEDVLYDIDVMARLPIRVEGEDKGEQTFFEQILEEERIQATLDTYGIQTDVPVVGSIRRGDQMLYVVDIADYTPELMLWDYKLITDQYRGETFTYLTDQTRNIRVMLTMDEAENYYLFAFDVGRNRYYRVDKIMDEGQIYYMMSLHACQTLPEEMTEETMSGNTLFYAVDEEGIGGYYRYTTAGSLEAWQAEESGAALQTGDTKRNIWIVLSVVAVAGVAVLAGARLLRRRRKSSGRSGRIDLFSDHYANKKQYFFVIRELTSREIKRKYARSYLGIIWSVLNPLLTMAVMSLVFSYMFKRSIDQFPLYYLTGNLFWTLFSGATNSAMTALVDNKTLLLKAKLPKQTFVLSRVYTSLVNFGYTCIAYILMLIVFRIRPSWTMLLFPLDVALALLFATGIGYILSIFYVFFADIKYLYSVLLTLLLYLSAIFYPVTSLPPVLQKVIGFNPIYLTIYIAREAVVYNHIPHYTAWIKLAIAALISFGLGVVVFRKKQNDVMQRV